MDDGRHFPTESPELRPREPLLTSPLRNFTQFPSQFLPVGCRLVHSISILCMSKRRQPLLKAHTSRITFLMVAPLGTYERAGNRSVGCSWRDWGGMKPCILLDKVGSQELEQPRLTWDILYMCQQIYSHLAAQPPCTVCTPCDTLHSPLLLHIPGACAALQSCNACTIITAWNSCKPQTHCTAAACTPGCCSWIDISARNVMHIT